MKAMKLTGIREMEMMEVATPKVVNDDDVLIRMKVMGVCGSDVHYYETGRIGSQVVEYPYAVGHEGAGVVVLAAEESLAIYGLKPRAEVLGVGWTSDANHFTLPNAATIVRAIREAIDVPVEPFNMKRLEEDIQAARDAINQEDFLAAWHAGRGLEVDGVLRHVLGNS